MKRCIICGNVDDDNSTVCSTCGNPYVDMSARVSDAGGNAPGEEAPQESVPEQAAQEAVQELQDVKAAQGQLPDAEAVQELPKAEAPQAAEKAQERAPEPVQENQPAQRNSGEAGAPRPKTTGRPPRRTHGGPQIYGQEEGMPGDPQLYANQGMIRRNVPPRSAGEGRAAGQTQGGSGRPMGQMPGGAGRPNGGQAQGGSGRPMSQAQGGSGRPVGQDFLSRRVMETARRMMRSPLFFLIALLNTACVAASIAAIFMKELNYSQIVRLLNEAELPRQAAGYVSSATTLLQKLDSGMIVQNIALHIPSILFCLGLWLIFFTALTAKERMSGVGFGFAKAAVIIRLLAACAVMLAVLIITVTVVVAAWVSEEKTVIIMAVVMLVIAIIVVMMIIMYYFAYLGTLKTCRKNGNNGESYGKPSAYLAVLLILLALPGIVGLLSGIVNMEITNIVSSIAQMGWMILFAVWIFMYRGKMSELEG